MKINTNPDMSVYVKTTGDISENKNNDNISINVPMIKITKLISSNFDINAIYVISLFKSYRYCFVRKFIEEKIIYKNI